MPRQAERDIVMLNTSYCPIHTGIVSIRMQISTKSFHRLVYGHNLLLAVTAVTEIQGVLLCGGVKCTGVGKFAIFHRNRRLSGKRYESAPWLLQIIIWSHRLPIDSCGFQWPWVTFNIRIRRIKLLDFLWMSVTLVQFCPEWPKLALQDRWRSTRFLYRAPTPRGRCPASLKLFVIPANANIILTRATKFGMVQVGP